MRLSFVFLLFSFFMPVLLFSCQLEMYQGKWQVTSSSGGFCPLHQIKRGRRFSGNMDKNKIFLLDFLYVLIYGFVDFMAFHTIYHCDPISAKLIRD